MRLSPLPALIALSFWTSSAFAQDEHKIRLDYYPKEGETIEVTSTFDQSATASGAGVAKLVFDRGNRTGTFTIRITADKVDKNGRATEVSYKIVTYKATNNFGAITGQLSKHMIGKTVQLHWADGKRMYTEPTGVKGEKYVVDDTWTAILDLAVPLRILAEPGYDDLFGTADSQKKGATWQSDPAKVAAAYAKFSPPKEKIKGTVTLKDVKAKKDEPQLRIDGKLEMSGLTYKLPDGWKQDSDRFEVVFSTLIAPGGAELPVEQTVKTTKVVSGSSAKKKVTETTVQSVKATYKLVK